MAKKYEPFRVKAKSKTVSEIYLYGAIGDDWFSDDSVSAKQFADALNALPETTSEIHLRINSPGGDVFDGVSIYNLFKNHKAKKKVYIDGLCASIASIIALAGDEIVMGEGTLYMIHLPMSMAIGDRIEMEDMIERLMDVEEQMTSIYMGKMRRMKSNVTRMDIRKMLEKETWLDASQAFENGFIDTIAESDAAPIAASVIDKAVWLKHKPEVKTIEAVEKAKVLELKKEIESFVARK